MNAPVLRVFALFVVLFGVLVAFTSRWSVFEASALRANPNNHRVLLEEQRIRRGLIRASAVVNCSSAARDVQILPILDVRGTP